MKDERIIAVRDKVFQIIAVAEDDFESASLLLDSEKYRTSVPLYKRSLLDGVKALLHLHSDELPPGPDLIALYNRLEADKQIKLGADLQEIIEKLNAAEQDALKNPLRMSKESIQALEFCSKHIETFLAKAHKLLKRNLLTSEERKKKEVIKKVVLIAVSAVVAVFVLVQVGLFLSSLNHGLNAEYFEGQNFEKPIKTKREKRIDFNWDLGSLVEDYVDNVSIRCTGRIKAPSTGRYTFLTRSDDGTRLWIDDKLIIDDWNVHPEDTRSAEVDLEEGYHHIKLEYFEGEGFASLKLLWIRPGTEEQQIIKPSFLRRNK